MPVSAVRSLPSRSALACAFAAFLLAIATTLCPAASIRGVVTDTSGAKVTGANVSLINNGKPVATAVSTADGSFEILTGIEGRFFLVVSARTFRQLATPDFYAGKLDNIERNLVVEPEWARESIVVTATGTPTPQEQTGATTSVLGPLDFSLRADMPSLLRLMPGVTAVEIGQRGAQTSLFVRGGPSDGNKIIVDGVDAGDLGNQFDFGQFTTTALESAEVYRGPNSSLYGAGATSGVVNLVTPHGTTSFPSILFEGDAGNLSTSHERLDIAGAHNQLDYLAAFSWLQTANDLPFDEYHIATTAANLGWQPNGSTQIRGTMHYNVAATGVPNAWDFYHVADDATQKDQNIFLSASIDNQTTPSFHNSVKYGLTRKREQENVWAPEGICIPAGTCLGPVTYTGGNYFGLPVTIQGANGYSAVGPALLDYSQANGEVYPSGFQLVSNRDQLIYRGDVTITPHLTGLIGFQYEDERGAEPGSFYYLPVERSNYDYIASVHGDFKRRVYYTLGGGLEHYSLFGVQTTPRADLSFFAIRPRSGIFSGTRVLFNFGKSVREPSLPQQDYSLYTLLAENDEQADIQQFHITPLAAPAARTYEGGIEQTFWDQRIVLRGSYFHNEFTHEIEFVGTAGVIALFPNLSPLMAFLNNNSGGADLNSQAFRAQGIESTVETGIGKSLFFRGGYTYLDAVTQHSFNSDNAYPALCVGGILCGAYSPLVGARPFRRAPHTGFITATYAERKLTGVFTAAFASRSDDSTYLEYDDVNGGNSLLLPNRNLDFGYAKLDLGGSYQLLNWLGVYAQAENLLDNQHIAPIGFPSLPGNIRTGLRIEWGVGKGH